MSGRVEFELTRPIKQKKIGSPVHLRLPRDERTVAASSTLLDGGGWQSEMVSCVPGGGLWRRAFPPEGRGRVRERR